MRKNFRPVLYHATSRSLELSLGDWILPPCETKNLRETQRKKNLDVFFLLQRRFTQLLSTRRKSKTQSFSLSNLMIEISSVIRISVTKLSDFERKLYTSIKVNYKL